VDPAIARGKPSLTQARVTVHLTDGRTLSARADGARGYPDRPTSDDELDAKFLACARRALDEQAARRALDAARGIDRLEHISALTASLTPAA
jgi:2-methylcitrate dehydratase PrpD